jgi:Zn-dependent protease
MRRNRSDRSNRGGFSLGRIFGIAIRINVTWLLVLPLVAWNLSSAFSRTHPDWNAGLAWGIGLVAALLLFASVLAHELAHSLVAKAQGIPVDDITLFLFGGVSDIEEEPKSPGGEFLMAILGPGTSLVIGIVLLLLGGSFADIQASGMNAENLLARLSPMHTLVLWLGSINIVLGVFNLTPGFPLDGGRILRSIVWGISGNLQLATNVATGAGKLIAFLMIAGGILMIIGVRIPIFGTGIFNGIWLALIGWFLYSGAQRYRNRRMPSLQNQQNQGAES